MVADHGAGAFHHFVPRSRKDDTRTIENPYTVISYALNSQESAIDLLWSYSCQLLRLLRFVRGHTHCKVRAHEGFDVHAISRPSHIKSRVLGCGCCE